MNETTFTAGEFRAAPGLRRPQGTRIPPVTRAQASKLWISALTIFWCSGSLWCCACAGKPRAVRAEVAEALGAVRPSPGRLFGLSYAPFAQNYSPPETNRRLERIAVLVRKRAERVGSAVSLADRAVLSLAVNRLDSATSDLEAAVRKAPSDARILSDLSACYLARGNLGEPLFFAKALDVAKRARSADSHRAEVLFNWAFALERNFLIERAIAAWTDYLRFDSDSPWAREATEHLKALEQPSRTEVWARQRLELDRAALRGDGRMVRRIVEVFPYRSRKYAEDELLPGWAEAVVAGRHEESGRLLKILHPLGQALVDSHGEHLVADAVAAMDRSLVEKRVVNLAWIEHALIKGRALCQGNQGVEGTAWLLRVREVAERTQSPIPEFAVFHLAGCSYARADYRQALFLLEGLLHRPGIERYPSLLGRVQWLRGMAFLSLAEPMPSLRSYEAAVASLKKAGEAEEVGALSYIIANNFRYLGDESTAWKWLFLGIAEAVRGGEVRTLYAAFDELAHEAERQGQNEAALLFRSEVVRFAFQDADEAGITHALLSLGQAHYRLGHRTKGLEILASSERHCAQIADADARDRWQADVLLAIGKAVEDPQSALPLLSKALVFYRRREDLLVVDAFLARAQAFRKMGDGAAAEQDLRAGIEEFERQRGTLSEESLRLSYFEQARELFDLVIDAAAGRPGGSEVALSYVERERARVLLDRIGAPGSSSVSGGSAQPLAVAAIRQQIPEGVTIIEYAMLQDRLLLWVLRRDQVQMRISHIEPKEAQNLVANFRRGLKENYPEEALAAPSSALFSALVSPALPWIRSEDILIFIPDKTLHLVPFAALRDPASKRYLIQEHAIGVAPSATLFIRNLARARSLKGQLDALVVGQPHVDLRRFQGLGELTWGSEEISEVAAIYGSGAEVLIAERATPRMFLRRAGEHAVVHVGSHALANEAAPSLSGLILTPVDEEDAGVLYARDIERMSFKRTRLVVLSACDTAVGVDENAEGLLSLSRSFFAAGVPSVIASLWSIDDRAALKLSLDFHQRLRAGQNSIAALRDTQLALLYGPNNADRQPTHWASFQHFGSFSGGSE